MLVTTRAYALEKLAAAGEADARLARHAQVVCDFFERTEDARAGEQGTLRNMEFVRRAAPELDNARAAMDWASNGLTEVGRQGWPGVMRDLNLAVGLAAAAAQVFASLALPVEALDRLMAWIHRGQGQYKQALAMHEQERALLLAAGDEKRSLLTSESNLCRTLILMDRFDECSALAREVIAREGTAPSSAVPHLFQHLITAQAFSGRLVDAQETMLLAMPSWRRNGIVLWVASALAVVLAELGRWADAARVGAADLAHQGRIDMQHYASHQRTNARWQALLAGASLPLEDLQRWQREGQMLHEAAVAAICLAAAT